MGKQRGIYEKAPGSDVWWVRHADTTGRIRREKAGTWSAARDLYFKRKTEALQGRKLPEKMRRAPVTFPQIARLAVDDIQRRYRHPSDALAYLARAMKWFGSRAASEITPGEIEAKLSAVADSEHWAPSTYNHHLNAISLSYKLALRAGQIAGINPARQGLRRKGGTVRQGFITDAKYFTLARACERLWLRTMLALGFTYGWRAGELIGLRVAQVDTTARTIRLEPGTTKNCEGRVVRLTGECFELVMACVSGKDPSEPVLAYENGAPVRAYRHGWEQLCAGVGLGRFICRMCGAGGPATTAAGRKCPACSKAKRQGTFRYQGLLFHDLRRSAVRNLERAGVARSVATKITGHKTESVYRRYAIVSEVDLIEAVARLERRRCADTKNELTPELAPSRRRTKAESTKIN